MCKGYRWFKLFIPASMRHLSIFAVSRSEIICIFSLEWSSFILEKSSCFLVNWTCMPRTIQCSIFRYRFRMFGKPLATPKWWRRSPAGVKWWTLYVLLRALQVSTENWPQVYFLRNLRVLSFWRGWGSFGVTVGYKPHHPSLTKIGILNFLKFVILRIRSKRSSQCNAVLG